MDAKTLQHEQSSSRLTGYEKFDETTITKLRATVRMDAYHYSVEAFTDYPAWVNAYVRAPSITIDEPTVRINILLPEWQRCKTYVHECCHLIAQGAGLDSDPRTEGHSRFFGVLVAVAYRRLNALPNLTLYEFSDTFGIVNSEPHPDYINDPRVQPISDSMLVDRFRFIITESKRYAEIGASLEAIAQDLASRFFDGYGQYSPPQARPVKTAAQPAKRGWLRWFA